MSEVGECALQDVWGKHPRQREGPGQRPCGREMLVYSRSIREAGVAGPEGKGRDRGGEVAYGGVGQRSVRMTKSHNVVTGF